MNIVVEPQIVMAVMRNIALENDPHGSFLTYFSKAMVAADLANQRILMPVAEALIIKYDLVNEQIRRGVLKPEQYEEGPPA